MLKACWGCLGGPAANREAAGNGEAYGIHLNGDNTQRAPPWPTPRMANEKMFILPKRLENSEKIRVSGRTTNNRQKFTVNLLTGANGSPDYSNIACQIETDFEVDQIRLQIVQYGSVEIAEVSNLRPSSIFRDTSFDFQFTLEYTMADDGNTVGELTISFGSSIVGSVQLKHNVEDVRFLTVTGDIEKVVRLAFIFEDSEY